VVLATDEIRHGPLRSAPGLLLFLMEQGIEMSKALKADLMGESATVYCRLMQATLR
jgi:hypothetical protein